MSNSVQNEAGINGGESTYGGNDARAERLAGMIRVDLETIREYLTNARCYARPFDKADQLSNAVEWLTEAKENWAALDLLVRG